MQEMSRRNQHFTDSVIRRMTRISNECGAINLAQGFPDFDPPKEMMDRLEVVSHEGPHQYPITMGAPNFRQAIARKCGHFMGRTIDPETEIVATIGSTEAMVDTLFALTNPGDRVVMFSPFFENYRAQVIMADCEPVFVPLNPPTFSFDPNVLEDAFRGGAKAIIICNPSNPSGKVFTEEELKTIADLCIRYDVYAIMDEVYEHIIYDGRKHVYMNSIPGMWERTVSCSSLSKTYSVTGWRLGYVCGPQNIIEQMTKIHQFAIMCAPTTAQYAAIEALKNGDEDIVEMRTAYNQRRRFLMHAFREMGLECFEPYGAFYVFPCIKEFGMTSEEFATRFLEEEKVAAVPGDAFGASGEGYLRISYAYSLEKLKMAMERLAHFSTKLREEKGK